MAEATPAGWYPDPAGGGGRRYWDGTGWTAHVSPDAPMHPAPAAREQASTTSAPAPAAPASAPESGARPTRKRRRGLIVGLSVTGGVALIAVVTLVVGMFTFLRPIEGVPAALRTDLSEQYDYTDPMLDLDRDHEFHFDVDYLLRDVNAANSPKTEQSGYDEGRAAPDWAFQVYYDAALTHEAGATVVQPASSTSYPSDDRRIRVVPNDSTYARAGDGQRDISDSAISEWSLHDEYYLVQRADKEGNPLAKPIVTMFTVKRELATPVASLGTPTGDGSLALTWQAVDGATEYLVVASKAQVTGPRSYTLLGSTSDTTWTSESVVKESGLQNEPWPERQNDALKAYEGSSADEEGAGYLPGPNYGTSGWDFGVIATDGQRFSPYQSFDTIGQGVGALPYQIATATLRGEIGTSVASISALPKTVPFTSLDGATRAAITYVDASQARPYREWYMVPMFARGTQLGTWTYVPQAAVTDLQAEADAFNAAALAAAPPTGAAGFQLVSAPVDPNIETVDTYPDVAYPVFGSTELTRFIAAHLIAGSKAVDISALSSAPGAPQGDDALDEALNQNPYALGVKGAAVYDNKTLYVTYDEDHSAIEAQQAEIKTAVDAAVAAVTTPEMSAQDKAVALNDWLTAHAEYDYAALEAKNATGVEAIPDGYEDAWTAAGVLLKQTGVCASYADAYHLLMQAADVDSVVVTGTVYSGGRHAWNKVNIDGAWLAVDSTWNDSPDANRFLLIPDSGFQGSAARSEDESWMVDSLISSYATTPQ
ncbi:hypothetical protein GCM10027058_22280 [Microbacterium neimengense]